MADEAEVTYLFRGEETAIDGPIQDLVELGFLEYVGDGTPTVRLTVAGVAMTQVLVTTLGMLASDHPHPDLTVDTQSIVAYVEWMLSAR